MQLGRKAAPPASWNLQFGCAAAVCLSDIALSVLCRCGRAYLEGRSGRVCSWCRHRGLPGLFHGIRAARILRRQDLVPFCLSGGERLAAGTIRIVKADSSTRIIKSIGRSRRFFRCSMWAVQEENSLAGSEVHADTAQLAVVRGRPLQRPIQHFQRIFGCVMKIFQST